MFQGALAKPIIQPELGSLVPQNIRQRYLNALIEECKKFTSEKESFNIVSVTGLLLTLLDIICHIVCFGSEIIQNE